MSKKERLIFSFLIFALFEITMHPLYAWEWKALHERADKDTLPEALAFVGKNPSSSDGLYILGLDYLNSHRDTEAEGIFKRILAQEPSMYAAKWGEAEVLRRRHKLQESEKMLRGIISRHPEFSPAYISLAYLRFTKHDYLESLRLGIKVISQRQEDVDKSNYTRAYLIIAGSKGMLAYHGGLFSKLRHGLEVYSYLKKARDLQPDSAGVLFGLGSYYLLSPSFVGGDLGKALRYLNQAIQADPFFADAYVRLAQAYKAKGLDKEFQYYLEKSQEIDPGNELALDIASGSCKFICLDKR